MACVVLTGSTGNVGSYLVAELAALSHVESVYCLNRSSNARTRQPALLEERGLELPPAAWAKIHFHRCAVEDASLGLDDALYRELQERCTHIVHCAWPVNFNRSFESFAPSIDGVANLVRFAQAAPHPPRLLFVSSVSAAGNWGALPGARFLVPEEEIDDWKVARMGYGQSKLVAERLLADASRSQGLTTAICRVGQVGGPIDHGTKGIWPQQEWLPSLIASSIFLGKVPATLGPLDDVDWVPVDRLASIIAELVFSEQPDGTARFHHIVNPHTCRWSSLLSTVSGKDGRRRADQPMETTDFPEWVAALRVSSQDPLLDVGANPAIKLQDFFESLREKAVFLPRARGVRLDVKQTKRHSPTLAQLEPVQPAWMELWMRQWNL